MTILLYNRIQGAWEAIEEVAKAQPELDWNWKAQPFRIKINPEDGPQLGMRWAHGGPLEEGQIGYLIASEDPVEWDLKSEILKPAVADILHIISTAESRINAQMSLFIDRINNVVLQLQEKEAET